MDRYGLGLFLLGLGIGVGVGMLVAPQPGEHLRERIKAKTDEGAEYLKQKGNQLRDSAANVVGKGKQDMSEVKEDIEEAVLPG